MQVVDHEPGCWFLLQEEDAVYLDVLCDRGMVSFCVDVQLTPEERELYARGGRQYIVSLADAILARSDPAEPRQLRDRGLQDRITATIITWNQQHA